MEWFLGCLAGAFDDSENVLTGVLGKARFWSEHAGATMNPRQRRVVNRLLDEFEGKLTTTKWARVAGGSQDTALRDIQDLIRRGILAKDPAGGRSTSYSLAGV